MSAGEDFPEALFLMGVSPFPIGQQDRHRFASIGYDDAAPSPDAGEVPGQLVPQLAYANGSFHFVGTFFVVTSMWP
jgi:hypothetical protein